MMLSLFIIGDLLAVSLTVVLLCRKTRMSNCSIGAIAGIAYGAISILIEAMMGCVANQWESMCGMLIGIMHLPLVLSMDALGVSNLLPVMVTLILLVVADAVIGAAVIGFFLLTKVVHRTIATESPC